MAEQIYTSGQDHAFDSNEGLRSLLISAGTSSSEIEITNAMTSSMTITWAVTPASAADQIAIDLKKPSLHSLSNEAVDSNLEKIHIDKGDVNEIVIRRVTTAATAVDVTVAFNSNRRHTNLSHGRVYYLNKGIYTADLDDASPDAT